MMFPPRRMEIIATEEELVPIVSSVNIEENEYMDKSRKGVNTPQRGPVGIYTHLFAVLQRVFVKFCLAVLTAEVKFLPLEFAFKLGILFHFHVANNIFCHAYTMPKMLLNLF